MLKLFRKNNRTAFQKSKGNSGFALLFAVLMSSLMLSIGLSIFGIAIRELSISTAARQSIFAFYAADSGRECVLYWDIKKGSFPTLIGETSGGGNVKCGGDLHAIPTKLCAGGTCAGDVTSQTILTKINVNGSGGPYSDVTVDKSWLNGISGNIIQTKITADGYDSDGGNKILRSIFQTINTL